MKRHKFAYSKKSVGPYEGAVASQYDAEKIVAQLAHIDSILRTESICMLSCKDDPVVHLRLASSSGFIDVAVKAFIRQAAWKDIVDHTRGSRARRSWQTAVELMARGIGTPEPIAFLEKWNGSRLIESYFISRYEMDMSSFRNELIYLYKNDPACWKLMNLLQCVANAVRGLHDAGILHGDMGNQNILLRKNGNGQWGDVKFIDLNRVRIRDGSLSTQERAFDASRISLPSDLLRIFKEMYFTGPPTAEFQRAERRYRSHFAIRSWTRKLRHPIRSRQRECKADPSTIYPPLKDIWIWDDRSAQAVNVLQRKHRNRRHHLSKHVRIAIAVLSAGWSVRREYMALLKNCFNKPVDMRGRVGVSIEPTPETLERELGLLRGLGKVPVMARFYHHQNQEAWDFTARVLTMLREEGHPIAVSLVQDRRAVLQPSAWESFINHVFNSVGGVVEWVQVGHAMNRVKWGIWSFDQYRRLLESTWGVARRYPDVKIMGPAAIDFEYHYLVTALRHLPKGFHFDALSHLLYVDRRGAPENRQRIFSALEKFALARAIARTSGVCSDRLIISEVNWPLVNGGIYSPIGAPYMYPGLKLASPPSVTEEQYANYMVRYLLLALCSGMVERVYWWRLVSRGFGLVDDTEPASWRSRPAYYALRHFLATLSAARFVKREPSAEDIYVFHFERTDSERVIAAYVSCNRKDIQIPFAGGRVEELMGRHLEREVGTIPLTDSPVYLRQAKTVK